MKLGLITDIHEHVEYLERALCSLASRAVDQIIVIGDVFEMGARIDATCRLLNAAGAIGVWGNHDVGLCFDVDDDVRARYPATVFDFMTSLGPRLEVDGCHFTHVEPWLDPEDVADLWYYEGPPESPEKLARIFAAVPNRVVFSGHLHHWLLATPAGLVDWEGQWSIRLTEHRYFVVVGALCEGRFATYDTETTELLPFNLT